MGRAFRPGRPHGSFVRMRAGNVLPLVQSGQDNPQFLNESATTTPDDEGCSSTSILTSTATARRDVDAVAAATTSHRMALEFDKRHLYNPNLTLSPLANATTWAPPPQLTTSDSSGSSPATTAILTPTPRRRLDFAQVGLLSTPRAAAVLGQFCMRPTDRDTLPGMTQDFDSLQSTAQESDGTPRRRAPMLSTLATLRKSTRSDLFFPVSAAALLGALHDDLSDKTAGMKTIWQQQQQQQQQLQSTLSPVKPGGPLVSSHLLNLERDVTSGMTGVDSVPASHWRVTSVESKSPTCLIPPEGAPLSTSRFAAFVPSTRIRSGMKHSPPIKRFLAREVHAVCLIIWCVLLVEYGVSRLNRIHNNVIFFSLWLVRVRVCMQRTVPSHRCLHQLEPN
jgi:hypothetical protein